MNSLEDRAKLERLINEKTVERIELGVGFLVVYFTDGTTFEACCQLGDDQLEYHLYED